MSVGKTYRDVSDLMDRVADELINARLTARESVQLFRMRLLKRAVEVSGGNVCAAARLVQMHRNNVAAYAPREVRNTHKKRPVQSVHAIAAERHVA